MASKQAEMDNIVRDIYQAMETSQHLQSTLLVLTGDHGMNEAGNHGGSSEGEVSTALVFVSPKFKGVLEEPFYPVDSLDGLQYFETIEQSDIAPSLAALLGFPVPRNNLGIIIPQLLELWAHGEFSLAQSYIPSVAKAETRQKRIRSTSCSKMQLKCLSSHQPPFLVHLKNIKQCNLVIRGQVKMLRGWRALGLRRNIR
jgi:hypothetical protein